MWRRQTDERPSPAEPAAPPAPAAPAPSAQPESTHISPAVRVKGEITGREDLYLNGAVQGTVRVEGARVTVGLNGRVLADLDAEEILVLGQVEGNLRARTRIEVRRSGVVLGDLWTSRLAVEEGAVVHGKVEMTRAGQEASAKARTAAASAGAETIPGHEP